MLLPGTWDDEGCLNAAVTARATGAKVIVPSGGSVCAKEMARGQFRHKEGYTLSILITA